MQVLNLDLNNAQSKASWDDFCEEHQNVAHHHTTNFLEAILNQMSEHCNESIMCIDNQGTVQGILPLVGLHSPIFGKQLVSIPFYNYGGVICEGSDVKNVLMKEAYNLMLLKGYKKTLIRDREVYDDYSPFKTQMHKANLVLDLPDDIKSVGTGNSKKRTKLRSQAGVANRKADELGITFEQRFGGEELLDDFYTVFSKHMRDLGTPVYGKGFFITMMENIESLLTVCYWDNKPVACGWLFIHGERVSIPWASALRETNSYSVNTAMYYNILSKLILLNKKTFDFGRSSIDTGTYKFKLQWGAQPEQCYWHIANKNGSKEDLNDADEPSKAMVLLISTWKRLPVWITRIVGPRIIRGIP
jgi:FemAB-related protein (PEP-CTERM system-associated)